MFGSGLRSLRFESRIVWVFGSPRSGSTWLWGMLRELDPVVAINEPQIGYYLGPFASDSPGVRASDLDSSNFTLRRLQSQRDQQFFAESYRDVWGPLLRRMLTERFRAHARRVKPGVPLKDVTVVVKEPNGSQSADIIMAAQPKARLLFLLRDGRDVVDSLVAASEEGSWTTIQFPIAGIPAADRFEFTVGCAHKWLWQTEVVQEAFRDHRGPKLLVRYEDLRAEPHAGLTAVLQLLGLDVDDRKVHELVERHSFERIPEAEKGRKSFYRAATPGLWRENLTPAERERVNEILGPKLRELGYEA